MRFKSALATIFDEFMLRLRFLDLPVRMCAPPAEVRLIFPVPVILKRLAIAFLVFCFGITNPFVFKLLH